MDQAECAKHKYDLIRWIWFPEGYEHNLTADAVEAKRICNTVCAIQADCLQYAIDMERRSSIQGRSGVWGGLDEQERYELSNRGISRPLLPCGTNAAYKRHLHAGEMCPICRPRTNRKRRAA